jgi:aspartate 1-decarboxylase
MKEILASKIHQATVTQADVSYIGSITIDIALIERAGLWLGQKVLVVSNTSGARLETYVIAGNRHSGEVQINGAAAHLIQAGEQVIIIGFEITDQPIKQPQCILVDAHNRFVRMLGVEEQN